MKVHLASPVYPTTKKRSHVEVTALSDREADLLLQKPAQTSWKQQQRQQRMKMLVNQPGQLTAIATRSIRF